MRTVQADVEHTKNILEVYCPTRVVKEYHKGNNGAKAARQSNGKNAGLPYLEKPLLLAPISSMPLIKDFLFI